MWNRRPPRLVLRILLELTLAVVLLIGLYVATLWGTEWLVGRLSATGQVLDQELEATLGDLQAYVSANNLSTTDSAALRTWDQGNHLLELQLVSGGTVIYDSSRYGRGTARSRVMYVRVPDAQNGVIHFADADATVNVSLAFYHNLEREITLVAAFLCIGLFVLVMGIRLTSLVRDILRIDEGVRALESGDLTHRIQVTRTDELGDLAASLNRMAEELQWRNELEDSLRKRYSDMITAVSHDLRTPLTAVIGYLELLEAGGQSEAQREDYLRRSLDRARFIGQMTDRLFDSARTGAETGGQAVRLDGQEFLAQRLEEMDASLTAAGFQPVLDGLPREDFMLEADPVELRRVMSNLEGNIRRYADPAAPVHFRAALEGSALHVVQFNQVRPGSSGMGSGVGLRSAKSILAQYGGSLEVQQTGETFLVDLWLETMEPEKPTE